MKRVTAATRRGLLVISVAAMAAAAACTDNFLPGSADPPRLFVLSPKSTYPKELPTIRSQLTIDLPVAEAGLNTARIAVRRSPISLEYYARANWIDTAPTMVQTLLVESFENSGKIVSVGRQSVTLRPDFSLLTELREFQSEYLSGAEPSVRVRLNVKLVKMPQRIIIAAKSFERVEPAADGELPAVVAAFDTALGKVLKRTVIWTLTNVPQKG